MSCRAINIYTIADKFNEWRNACVEVYNVNLGKTSNTTVRYKVTDGEIKSYAIKNGIYKVEQITEYMTTVPHALPNYKGIYKNGVDISASKCWFNSTMLNLYNSKVVQNVVSELARKLTNKDDMCPSKWIKRIFDDIRDGDMSEYGDHLQGLITAMNNLG